MACSTLYAKKSDETPKFTLSNDAHMPDVPPHLEKCVRKERKGGATADEAVIDLKQTDEERRACSEALLKWYKEIQAANGKPPVPEKKPQPKKKAAAAKK